MAKGIYTRDEAHINGELKKLCETAKERLWIYMRRYTGLPKEQWTEDEVFKEYAFCNVFRWQDATSALIYSMPCFQTRRDFAVLMRWLGNRVLLQYVHRDLAQDPHGLDNATDDEIVDYLYELKREHNMPLAGGSYVVHRSKNDRAQIKGYLKASREFVEWWHTHDNQPYVDMEKACDFWRDKSGEYDIRCGEFVINTIMYDFWLYPVSVPLYGMAHAMSVGRGARAGLQNIYGRYTMKHFQQAHAAFSAYFKDTLHKEFMEEWGHVDIAKSIAPFILGVNPFDTEHWLCEYFKHERGHAKRHYVEGRFAITAGDEIHG